MDFGVFTFPTDYSMNIVDLGRALEERGFESLFVAEHTHIPASRESPWGGGPELPQEYWHSQDPFVALSAVAANTTRLRLATGICLVVEHEPIALAKAIASLDHISNGRFMFGIGGGWNREEMRNHGTPFEHRFKVMRERILAMKQIWTQDEASYHGDYVEFERIWSWPKPVQKPHPPILIGGDSPRTLQRVVDYGDEWMPIFGRRSSPEERVPELNRLAAERGRGPIPVTAFGAPPDAERIKQYASAGVSRCVFHLPSAGAEEVLPRLDQMAELMATFA